MFRWRVSDGRVSAYGELADDIVSAAVSETSNLLRDAMRPFNEAKVRRDAIQTTVVYHRTAIVKRYEDGGYDVRGGGYGGDVREFEVTEPVTNPTDRLPQELKLIRITKVTTTTEVVG